MCDLLEQINLGICSYFHTPGQAYKESFSKANISYWYSCKCSHETSPVSI